MYDATLITSAVCVRCGACCSMYFRKGTMELVSLDDNLPAEEVEIVACPHLLIEDGLHRCGNYEARPLVCRQYNRLTQANDAGLALSPDQSLDSRVHSAIRSVFGRELTPIPISLVD